MSRGPECWGLCLWPEWQPVPGGSVPQAGPRQHDRSVLESSPKWRSYLCQSFLVQAINTYYLFPLWHFPEDNNQSFQFRLVTSEQCSSRETSRVRMFIISQKRQRNIFFKFSNLLNSHSILNWWIYLFIVKMLNLLNPADDLLTQTSV